MILLVIKSIAESSFSKGCCIKDIGNLSILLKSGNVTTDFFIRQ